MYRATISYVVSAWTALEVRNSETATHPNLLCMQASKGRALSLKIGREPSAECRIYRGTTDRTQGPRAAEICVGKNSRRQESFPTLGLQHVGMSGGFLELGVGIESRVLGWISIVRACSVGA